MAVSIVIHAGLNGLVQQYVAADDPSEPIQVAQIAYSRITNKSTLTPRPVQGQDQKWLLPTATAPLAGTAPQQTAGTGSPRALPAFTDPSNLEITAANAISDWIYSDTSDWAYEDSDQISIYTRLGATGTAVLGLSVIEDGDGEYLGVNKIATSELAWTIQLILDQNTVDSASFSITNPPPASDAEMAAGVIRDKYANPGNVNAELTRRVFPNSQVTTTEANLDNHITVGHFLFDDPSGGWNASSLPSGVLTGVPIYLRVEQYAAGNKFLRQILVGRTTSGPNSWVRYSTASGASRVWGDWLEGGVDFDAEFNDRLIPYQWSEITIDGDGSGATARVSGPATATPGNPTIQVTAGGTGYTQSGTSATIDAGVGTGAVLTVTVTSGAVTAITSTGGSGYSEAVPVAIANGKFYPLFEVIP